MRILHLPTDVGGNSLGLSTGEKKIGLNSNCLITQGSWLSYPYDVNLNITTRNKLLKLFQLSKAFLKIRSQYDVYHFNFGSSMINANMPFLRQFELPFYPRSAKLFMTYNGGDIRQKFYAMERVAPELLNSDWMSVDSRLNHMRKMNAARASRYMDHIFYLNPDLAHFLPADKSTFLPYTIASWEKLKATPLQSYESEKLKIVHAPTDKFIKGTRYIIDAVEKLKARGKKIELKLIEKMPQDQALREYQEADLVIDQLLLGWYGALAVECMKMGKPVLCHIEKGDLGVLPPGMANELHEGIIEAAPRTLSEKLLEIYENRSILRLKSQAGADFVNKWHDPIRVAQTVRAFYEK